MTPSVNSAAFRASSSTYGNKTFRPVIVKLAAFECSCVFTSRENNRLCGYSKRGNVKFHTRANRASLPPVFSYAGKKRKGGKSARKKEKEKQRKREDIGGRRRRDAADWECFAKRKSTKPGLGSNWDMKSKVRRACISRVQRDAL